MVKATYSGEDFDVTFTANTERSDYGVPGSPVWDEIVDVEIDSVAFLGVDVDPKTLPKQLINNLLEYADELELDDWS